MRCVVRYDCVNKSVGKSFAQCLSVGRCLYRRITFNATTQSRILFVAEPQIVTGCFCYDFGIVGLSCAYHFDYLFCGNMAEYLFGAVLDGKLQSLDA